MAYRLNGKPASPLEAARWREGRPVMNWSAVMLALFGSGCLGGNLAAAITLAFGAGSATSLGVIARLLDESPAKWPLLALSTALALGILISLERQRRLRRECVAQNPRLEMTPKEKRSVHFAAGSAVLALALVAFELWAHLVVWHPSH